LVEFGLAVVNFTLAAVDAALLSGSTNGDYTSINVYFTCWITFFISLNLCLRYSDASIRDGVFLLQLLRSVAEDCVKPELILNGATEHERQQNAKYAISCAHKMGSMVFATWEDIVEARPRSILCFLAAAMAEDLRRHDGASAGAII